MDFPKLRLPILIIVLYSISASAWPELSFSQVAPLSMNRLGGTEKNGFAAALLGLMHFGLAIALALAALIGASLGLLGSGGSILAMPVLVYVAGIPVQEAVGMSLVIVGTTSGLGALLHATNRQVKWQAAGLFALAGTFGALAGARLTHLVADHILMLLFGAIMLSVGAVMIRKAGRALSAEQCRPVRCFSVGLVVGVLTGFLGVGGGLLILPALVMFADVPMHRAIGTSLVIICVNSFAGLAGHVAEPKLDWPVVLGFAVAALVGMASGFRLSKRLASSSLQRASAWSIIVLGAVLIVPGTWRR